MRKQESQEAETGGDDSPRSEVEDRLRRRNLSVQEKIIVIVYTNEVSFVIDGRNDVYAYIRCADHRELLPIKSERFEHWVRQKYFRRWRESFSDFNLKTAIQGLQSEAHFGGNGIHQELHNRVAEHDGAIFIDLSDEEWRAVRISSEGWTVEATPPPIFRRFSHQRAQVEPVEAEPADLHELWEIFPQITDRDQRLLIEVYLVCALIPGFPHPVIVVTGPHGCGKSLLMRVMRRLVDPSLTEDLALSMDRKELGLVLSQHHMPLFDNVSQITDWMSNLFCTASTGSSTMEREYYTNEGVVIRFFRNVVGLNGIALAPRKADLLDRVLSIQLPGMRDEDRQVERILEERFEAMRPKLVGALFSSVSEALKQYPEVTIDELPRMAGFAVWGEAVARALGYEPGRFIEAYRRNRGEISEEVLARDPVGSSILLLLEGRDRWEGTPTELHEVLKRISRVASLHLTSFPGGAAALTRRIAEIIPNLDEEGVSITRPPRGKARLIILSRLRRVDDNDATSPIKKIGNSKGEIEESSSVSTAVTSEVADQ